MRKLLYYTWTMIKVLMVTGLFILLYIKLLEDLAISLFIYVVPLIPAFLFAGCATTTLSYALIIVLIDLFKGYEK